MDEKGFTLKRLDAATKPAHKRYNGTSSNRRDKTSKERGKEKERRASIEIGSELAGYHIRKGGLGFKQENEQKLGKRTGKIKQGQY